MVHLLKITNFFLNLKLSLILTPRITTVKIKMKCMMKEENWHEADKIDVKLENRRLGSQHNKMKANE